MRDGLMTLPKQPRRAQRLSLQSRDGVGSVTADHNGCAEENGHGVASYVNVSESQYSWINVLAPLWRSRIVASGSLHLMLFTEVRLDVFIGHRNIHGRI